MKRLFAFRIAAYILAAAVALSGCGTAAAPSAAPSAAPTPTPAGLAPAASPAVAADKTSSAAASAAPSGKFYGLNYSPYIHAGQSPDLGTALGEQQIDETLSAVAPYTRWIKTFGCTGSLSGVGARAHEKGLKVALGAWLGTDLAANDREIESLIAAGLAGQADVLVVGSETLYRRNLTGKQLAGYIEKVKRAVPGVPVATADTAQELLNNPGVVASADCVFANIYPYWNGVSVSEAINSLAGEYGRLKEAAGGKPVVIGETGWPDAGPAKGGAATSPENQARYMLDFCRWAADNGVPYFLFEAFDELWKAKPETPQESHWGLWGENGPKPWVMNAQLPDTSGIPGIEAAAPPSPTASPALTLSPTPVTPSPSPTPRPSPKPSPTKLIPDLSITKITARFGGYGGMTIRNYKNSGSFTMVLDGDDWASVGIDVNKGGKNVNLSGYRYAIIRAKGAKGGEEFRFGLGVGPTDYYFKDGLTKAWQDIVFDMSLSSRNRKNIFQVGFEIGPSWTNNAKGTTIIIGGIRFSNTLPKKYVLIDKEN